MKWSTAVLFCSLALMGCTTTDTDTETNSSTTNVPAAPVLSYSPKEGDRLSVPAWRLSAVVQKCPKGLCWGSKTVEGNKTIGIKPSNGEIQTGTIGPAMKQKNCYRYTVTFNLRPGLRDVAKICVS